MRILLKILFFFTIISVVFLIPFNLTIYREAKEEIHYSSVFQLTSDDTLWVEKTLANMTLKEKCAQMIMPYALGKDTLTNPRNFSRLLRLVEEEKVGGVLFLSGDIKNQVSITNKLQALADIPLLIAADFERGVGMRLQDGVEFPYNMALGAVNDPKLSYLVGKVTAYEGRALGVHQNLAPIMDINHDPLNPIINIRSYSSDKDITASNGTAFIRGLHNGYMLSTAKHFPGHGATDIDSHNDIPKISRSKKQLEMDDLYAFSEAVKVGVTAVMTGHLDVEAFNTSGIPATFSKTLITEVLQHKIGFDGLILTDAMNMGAIYNNYSQGGAAKLAIEAGNDLILFPFNEKAMLSSIYEAVKNGEISEERINHSVRKILAAKKWANLDKQRFVDIENLDDKLNQKEHFRLAAEIAEKSITLVKNDKNLIPINPDDYYATGLIIMNNSRSDRYYHFTKLVEEKFHYLKTHQLNKKSTKKDYTNALKTAKQVNLILLPIYVNIWNNSGSIQISDDHLAFIQGVLKLKKPVVIISFGNPYMLSEFPQAETYLCSYGSPDISQEAMLNAILGNSKISGKLPISIPNTDFKIGQGIQLMSKGIYYPPDSTGKYYDFSAVDSIMAKGISDSVFPGAVLLIGHHGKVIYRKPFGNFTYEKPSVEMTVDAMFDLASVSKVVGTTSAAMMLYDEGKLKLEDSVVTYLPEFGNNGKDQITIKNLLVHTAGLTPWKPFYKHYDKPDEVINDIMNSELDYVPGTETKYSDLGMITLQKVIEKISGQSLDKFLLERLFHPLEMTRTMYNPPTKYWYYCVPTEKDDYWRMMTLKGKVHDETAYLLGGVAGHAGLFSTADDLAKFMFVMLNDGKYGNIQFFKKETIDKWTSRQSNQSSRAIGWDTKSEVNSSAGKKFTKHSFGHTGYTGTSVWADKDRELFVILLTNRVHPTRENTKIIKFRPVLHDAVAEAVDY